MDRNFLAKDGIYFEWLLDFVFHFSILPFSSWLSMVSAFAAARRLPVLIVPDELRTLAARSPDSFRRCAKIELCKRSPAFACSWCASAPWATFFTGFPQ
jgi:hypothetical protein